MLNEPIGFPLGGGIMLTTIAYGLFSAFISGEVILERETQKLGWPDRCVKIVETQIRQSAPEPDHVPRIKLKDIFGGHSEVGDIFEEIFAPVEKVLEQKYEAIDRAIELNEQRLEAKAKAAGSRCHCAVTMLSEKRIALGLYAGSGRLVTPPLFKNLNSELGIALGSPRCAGRD